MAQWFRMYAEVVDDPKVQRLPADVFRVWVNILCLSAKNDGSVPPVADLAFSLRVSEAKVNAYLKTLSGNGLLDEIDGKIIPHNWNGRQYKSDVSTDRVKRFRERSGNGKETADGTRQRQNRAEAETETNSDSERSEFKNSIPMNRDPYPSADAIDKAREIAPRYDVHFLESQFLAFNKGKDVKNPDAAFIGFVRKHVEGNPL